MAELLSEIAFLFQRLTWTSVLDLVLVTVIIFTLLVMVRETQAVVLLRGVILIIILLSLLTSLVNLPAFSWLMQHHPAGAAAGDSGHLCPGDPPRPGAPRAGRVHAAAQPPASV